MSMVDNDISHMQTLFLELLHVTVGSCTKLSVIPSNKEWQCLYKMANKQALIGVCFHGVKQLPKEQLVNMPLQLKMQWFETSDGLLYVVMFGVYKYRT